MLPSESFDPSHHYTSVISQCFKTKSLNLGRLLHSHFIKAALTFNIFLANRLIDIYSKCNSVRCARRFFDDIPLKNTHSWNTIITAYSQLGRFDEAHKLFEEIPKRNPVSYNILISGLTRYGFHNESINLFKRMQKECNFVLIDEFTLVSLVSTCASLKALDLLHQLHGVAIVIGLKFNTVICNALIDAYGKCRKPNGSYLIFSRMTERDVVSWTSMMVAYTQASRLVESCSVFDQMPTKNIISWSALMAGFVQNGEGFKVCELFEQIQEAGVLPNASTYVSVLTACADLALHERGKQVHGYIMRCESENVVCNLFLNNALVDVYCKCGNMKYAMTLFERSPGKDTITWNSMITGFAQNGLGEESLALFTRMIELNIQPNHVTFLGLLSACNHTGLISEGIQILETMEKDFDVVPRSDHYAVLIDLLGRKNKLEEALELIKKAPPESNQIGMWGALLGACRVHGSMDLARKAADKLIELEPENTARYVMLANVYAAAGNWNNANGVRKLMDEKQLKKEAAFSWIEIQNSRYEFVAKEKLQDQSKGIYELLHNLVDQMKDTRCLHHIGNSFLPEDGIP